jgi:hypothetical protein
MKHSFEIAAMLVLSVLVAGDRAHARGFGGYHGGYGGGGFRNGGYGVGGIYEGALDGPRGFSGYGTNWSGYRGGYGIGTRGGFQGGYGLGYGGSGGLPGFDNFNRPGPWGRGVAGWRGELGRGGGYQNLGYGVGNYRTDQIRAGQFGAVSRVPGYPYGPSPAALNVGLPAERLNRGWALPSDFGLHEARGWEHPYGYLGTARGLTAFDPAAAALEDGAIDSPRIDDAIREAGGESLRGAAGEGALVNDITHYWPAAELRRTGNLIRAGQLAQNAFGSDWYDDYGSAWIANNIIGNLWTPAPWTTVNSWFNTTWPAVGYNYGNELTYDNGNVNLYGVPIATAGEYYRSAVNLAAQGKQDPPKNVDWLPLGIFAAVRGEEKTTNMMFQLAVDKAGVLRGNYFNTTDKNVQHIQGAVDKKTQRVTWIVVDRPSIIFDTGLYNLTKNETTILVHFDKDRVEQWTLVRLKQKRQTTTAP